MSSNAIQGTTNASAAAATNSSSSSSSSSSGGLNALGEQDFLTMLVAQLQNQDPLNPSDPTNFTAELAQFSSLEQLTNLNTNMTSMLTNSNTSTAMGMIGSVVSYPGNSFTYSGSNSVNVGYKLSGAASAVQVTITNSSGNVVKTINGTDLAEGDHVLSWNGQDQYGNAQSAGTYTISVQATGASGATITSSPLVTSLVTGVDMTTAGSGAATLNTQAGDVALSNVLGVYDSESD